MEGVFIKYFLRGFPISGNYHNHTYGIWDFHCDYGFHHKMRKIVRTWNITFINITVYFTPFLRFCQDYGKIRQKKKSSSFPLLTKASR